MKPHPHPSVRRWLAVAIVVSLLAALAAPAQAQTILIVAPDGYPTIDAALAAAAPGDVIEVHGGIYGAPLIIEKSVSLLGVGQPVIDGQGSGSLVLINAPDVVFRGFTLRSSGQSLTHEDTGIVIQSPRVTVADNLLDDVLFGIYFANAAEGLAQNNIIRGKPLEESMRGDSIRVWYSDNVQLVGNDISTGRDTLIWYANNIVIRDNHIHDSRYGLHFMYNKNAVVENNLIQNNAVGAYMMYSAGLVMTGNRFIHNRGASGYGIAFKDMDHARVTRNIFVGNMSAVYLDNSPSLYDEYNTFSDNFLAYNDVGLTALPAVKRNIFQRNSFFENHQQVSVQGRGSLLENIWQQNGVGNYWSDYVGYDGDNDGIGDMPYRAEKLFESLADGQPALRLFAFSPASQALDFAAAAFPALRPDPKVIDEAPLMQYAVPAGIVETDQGVSLPFLAAALALLGLGAGIGVFARRGGRRRHSTLKRPDVVRAGA